MAEQRLLSDEALALWVRDTCLLFGTTVETAYQVAGLFIKALNAEVERERAEV